MSRLFEAIDAMPAGPFFGGLACVLLCVALAERIVIQRGRL